MNLIQYTLNALDADYVGFVNALTHLPGALTFDDVSNKLLVHEHQVQFLRCHNSGSLSHPAFISTTISSSEAGAANKSSSSNSRRGKNNCNNCVNNNKNNRGKNSSNKNYFSERFLKSRYVYRFYNV